MHYQSIKPKNQTDGVKLESNLTIIAIDLFPYSLCVDEPC